MGYEKSQQIGVLVNTTDNQKHVDDFAEELKKDGKMVTLLNVDLNGIESGQNSFPVVSKKDVNVLGFFQSNDLIYFSRKIYDFLLVLDHQDDPFIQYIVACTQAKCVVGFIEDSSDLIDLKIKPANNNELKDVLKYTRMISNE